MPSLAIERLRLRRRLWTRSKSDSGSGSGSNSGSGSAISTIAAARLARCGHFSPHQCCQPSGAETWGRQAAPSSALAAPFEPLGCRQPLHGFGWLPHANDNTNYHGRRLRDRAQSVASNCCCSSLSARIVTKLDAEPASGNNNLFAAHEAAVWLATRFAAIRFI